MKILFIDDEKESLNELKEKVAKKGLVDFSYSIYDFFEPVDSGKSVKTAKNIDNYSYIFIHKSINDKKIPETIFSAIKKEVGENKLFVFSGGSENLKKEHQFKRKKLYKKFPLFIEFYLKYDDWYIPVLYDQDYVQKYAKKLIEEIRKLDDISMLKDNVYYRKMEKLLGLKNEVYNKYTTINQFINVLLNKIEDE